MIRLDQLKPAKGSKKKHFRAGQGKGSGGGKTAGRGQKGQNSRTGGGVRLGFEGGQMPLSRRIPKRGFKPPFKIYWETVSLDKLNLFPEKSEVDPKLLREKGYIKNSQAPVKILGVGKIEKSLVVKAHAFSLKAKEMIQKAGGKVEVCALD